jgi:restriction endonuclease S subunit
MSTMPVDGYKFAHSAIKKVSAVEKGYTYFAENDILLAKITPCFENGKCGIATNLKNGIGFGSTEFIVLRPKVDILPEYLYIFIANSNFIESGKSFMSGTAGQQRLQIDFVKNFTIPVVDIERQRQIINEVNYIYSLITSNKQIASKQQNKMQKFIQSLWKQDQKIN